MPSRLAPAAPANAPCGTASATKAAPRSTTKKPTTPATTATIVATIHALTMNGANIGYRSCRRCGRAKSCASRYPAKISATTKKLTGQPLWLGGQVKLS